jgi:hypothetical protein
MSSDIQTVWQAEGEMSEEFMVSWVYSPGYGSWCAVHETGAAMHRDDLLAYMGL